MIGAGTAPMVRGKCFGRPRNTRSLHSSVAVRERTYRKSIACRVATKVLEERVAQPEDKLSSTDGDKQTHVQDRILPLDPEEPKHVHSEQNNVAPIIGKDAKFSRTYSEVVSADEATQTRVPEDEVVGQPSILGQVSAKLQQLYSNIPGRTKGLVMLNALTLLMACNWFLVKDVETVMDPFAFTALRFNVAALAFLPVFKRTFTECEPAIRRAGLELGVWSAIGYILQGIALTSTDASRASFLSTFTVILVPIINGLGGRGITKLTWVGTVVALIGVAFLEQGGAPPSIGDVFGIASAAAFGIQMVRTEHHSKNLSKEDELPLIGCVVGTIAASAAVAAGAVHHDQLISGATTAVAGLPALLDGTAPLPGSFPDVPLGPLLFTSLLSTDLVLLLELWALEFVTSVDCAVVYSMEPVLGAAMAWAFLGERWGPLGWVGAAMIVGSSLAIQLNGAVEEEGVEGGNGDVGGGHS